jgi:hypothetical protein
LARSAEDKAAARPGWVMVRTQVLNFLQASETTEL